MSPNQSNTQEGVIEIIVGVGVVPVNGYLAKVLADSGNSNTPSAFLPTASTDICPFVVEDANTAGLPCGLRPMHSNRNVRLVASGSGLAGDIIISDTNNLGQVCKQPTSGAVKAFTIGVAEENYVATQFVLVRPTTLAVTTGPT